MCRWGCDLVFLVGCFYLVACVQRPGGEGDDDDDATDVVVEVLGEDFRCIPPGNGPFPGVLYNHGGLGDQIGGDLEGTCRALAEAGYVAYSKKRRATVPLDGHLDGHLDDVQDGADALQGTAEVDPDALAIVGFSRGGLLTLQAALLWPAVVLRAPAPANNTLSDTLADVSELAAPVLLQVSENDRFQSDHVQHVADITLALEGAGKPYESILYPPCGDDGHELFWEVQEPYWSDLVAFLHGQL
jgi:dienelactone hydrolase